MKSMRVLAGAAAWGTVAGMGAEVDRGDSARRPLAPYGPLRGRLPPEGEERGRRTQTLLNPLPEGEGGAQAKLGRVRGYNVRRGVGVKPDRVKPLTLPPLRGGPLPL